MDNSDPQILFSTLIVNTGRGLMGTSPLLRFGVTTALVLTLGTVWANADIKRTASGHPDLSGNYNVATLTPCNVPNAMATS